MKKVFLFGLIFILVSSCSSTTSTSSKKQADRSIASVESAKKMRREFVDKVKKLFPDDKVKYLWASTGDGYNFSMEKKDGQIVGLQVAIKNYDIFPYFIHYGDRKVVIIERDSIKIEDHNESYARMNKSSLSLISYIDNAKFIEPDKIHFKGPFVFIRNINQHGYYTNFIKVGRGSNSSGHSLHINVRGTANIEDAKKIVDKIRTITQYGEEFWEGE